MAEGCYKCMKYTLMIFNLIVLIIGGIVLGLAIYTYLTDFGADKLAVILGSDDLYKAGTILLIILGCITIVISFCGCMGAWRESRCLLGFYFAIMLLLTIVYVVVVVIGFVFHTTITTRVKQEAEESLKNKYGKSRDEAVTERWDVLQQKLGCCGVTGDVNSTTSWAFYQLETEWFKNKDYDDSLGSMYVPESCCDLNMDIDLCVGRNATAEQIPRKVPPLGSDYTKNAGLRTEGCYEKLEDFLRENAGIIGGVAVAALIIMLMGVVLSVCVCANVGKQGYVV